MAPQIDELADYDTVRVHFDDGSSTTIHVHQDADIGATVAELCDQQGWDTESVIRTSIEG